MTGTAAKSIVGLMGRVLPFAATTRLAARQPSVSIGHFIRFFPDDRVTPKFYTSVASTVPPFSFLPPPETHAAVPAERKSGTVSAKTPASVTLARMREFSANHDWFIEHQPDLLSGYDSKYVAISGERVIDSDSDLEPLAARLKERREEGEVPGSAYVGWVGPEEFEEALCACNTPRLTKNFDLS